VMVMNLSLKANGGTICRRRCQPQTARPSLAAAWFPYMASTGGIAGPRRMLG
jgi:hypothetical protein